VVFGIGGFWVIFCEFDQIYTHNLNTIFHIKLHAP
jgi:hypothetical protein